MKILIIEDEYSLADAIAETLRKENFNPNIITNGEEGENEILKIFKDLAKKENKCIIIVTHSQNVCNEVDTVYELVKE